MTSEMDEVPYWERQVARETTETVTLRSAETTLVPVSVVRPLYLKKTTRY
jgi:hypothetical protein